MKQFSIPQREVCKYYPLYSTQSGGKSNGNYIQKYFRDGLQNWFVSKIVPELVMENSTHWWAWRWCFMLISEFVSGNSEKFHALTALMTLHYFLKQGSPIWVACGYDMVLL